MVAQLTQNTSRPLTTNPNTVGVASDDRVVYFVQDSFAVVCTMSKVTPTPIKEKGRASDASPEEKPRVVDDDEPYRKDIFDASEPMDRYNCRLLLKNILRSARDQGKNNSVLVISEFYQTIRCDEVLNNRVEFKKLRLDIRRYMRWDLSQYGLEYRDPVSHVVRGNLEAMHGPVTRALFHFAPRIEDACRDSLGLAGLAPL